MRVLIILQTNKLQSTNPPQKTNTAADDVNITLTKFENYAKFLIATKTERLVTAKEERKITKIAMTNCQTLQDKIKGIKMIFDKSRKNFRR